MMTLFALYFPKKIALFSRGSFIKYQTTATDIMLLPGVIDPKASRLGTT